MATQDSRPEFVVHHYENGYGIKVAGDGAERANEILLEYWSERWVPCAECQSLVKQAKTIREGDDLTETCPCCGKYTFYMYAPMAPKKVA